MVLACLEKDPTRRPESAAELRRLLEACAVEPWDSVHAQRWWFAHGAELQGGSVEPLGEARTLAVDGAPRSSTELPA